MRRFPSFSCALGISTSAFVSAQDLGQLSAVDLLSNLTTRAVNTLKSSASPTKSSCTIDNAAVRRDWDDLSGTERREYIAAVQCILNKPSKSDPSFAPGARSRYDDFVANHINLTLSIHGTGNFLTWHRYFVNSYEMALRDECSYTGYQPYWNWFKYTDDPYSNPVFDGSDTSMSGDGVFKKHNGTLTGTNNIWIPSGNGGGCVSSGPFKNMTVKLGPVSPGMDGMVANPNGSLAYNPRCLSRDLSTYTLEKWMTATNLYNITVGKASHNITTFQNELQGRFGDLFAGMHAAGHMVMGGEASDLFSSPNDPAFFLHHAMLDKLYWLWQVLHPSEAKAIAGTITILNNPPSRDAKLSDLLDMGENAELRPISDLLDTLGNKPLCYSYL